MESWKPVAHSSEPTSSNYRTEEHFITLLCTKFQYRINSRIQFLWDQNTKWGVRLFIKGAWKQKTKREHDLFVIDKICETPRPTHILKN